MNEGGGCLSGVFIFLTLVQGVEEREERSTYLVRNDDSLGTVQGTDWHRELA